MTAWSRRPSRTCFRHVFNQWHPFRLTISSGAFHFFQTNNLSFSGLTTCEIPKVSETSKPDEDIFYGLDGLSAKDKRREEKKYFYELDDPNADLIETVCLESLVQIAKFRFKSVSRRRIEMRRARSEIAWWTKRLPHFNANRKS